MKKFFKLLLMIFLAAAGICFAVAAIFGAMHHEASLIPGRFWWQTSICAGALSVWCFIGIKKIYDDWYN